jgi:hypothetical protein
MKIWKSIIRIWFTLASVVSFLLGWAILAHAPKPNQFNPASVQALPQLDPVPSLNDMLLPQQSFNIVSPNRNVMSRSLRSGGS